MEKEPFSIPALVTGMAVSLVFGGILSIFADMIGTLTNNAGIALLVGAIPGVLFMLASRSATKNGFAQGLLIGGSIVALIGGACGAAFVTGGLHLG